MMIGMRALWLLLIASTAAAAPWKVSNQAAGVETEIHAADVPIDFFIGLLDGPVLVQTHKERVTGDVVAPSLLGAIGAAFDAAHVQLPKPFVNDRLGKGATMDVQFTDAPANDLLRFAADTLHANVVVKGGVALPNLSVVAHRVAADQFLELVALVEHLAVNRVGTTFYLLPKDDKLPVKLRAKDAVVDVDAVDAPAKLVAAAVAAVTKTVPVTCSDATLNLRVKRVALSEAVRAIEVNGGPLALSECALVPTKSVDLGKLKLVAIVGAGISRIAAGYVGDRPVLIEAGDGVEVGAGFVSANKQGVSLHAYDNPEPQPPLDYQAWRAEILGTALLVRRGVKWSGWLARKDGRLEPAVMPGWNAPLGMTLTVDAKGVTATYEGRSELIPLRK